VQLDQFLMIKGYDQFTLGCSVTTGDTVSRANPLVRAARGGSFDPFPDECSAVTCAAAVRYLLGRGGGGEADVTLGAGRGERLPTEEEFGSMFEAAA
jgi:hypothetical protein